MTSNICPANPYIRVDIRTKFEEDPSKVSLDFRFTTIACGWTTLAEVLLKTWEAVWKTCHVRVIYFKEEINGNLLTHIACPDGDYITQREVWQSVMCAALTQHQANAISGLTHRCNRKPNVVHTIHFTHCFTTHHLIILLLFVVWMDVWWHSSEVSLFVHPSHSLSVLFTTQGVVSSHCSLAEI